MKNDQATPETDAFKIKEGFIDDWVPFAEKLEIERNSYKKRCEELESILSVMPATKLDLMNKIEQYRDALQSLYDEQHGPPLIRYEKDWYAAMKKANKLL